MKPGLHEQLDVAAHVGARHVEAHRAALGAVTQEVLHEAEADVAGVGQADGVQLHDRPLVALGVALGPQQAGQAALVLVDVELVLRPQRPEGHAEQGEDADRVAADRQAERAHRGLVGAVAAMAQARQLADRGQVGQAGHAHAARRGAHALSRRAAERMVAPAGALRPGSRNASAMVISEAVEARFAGQLGVEGRGQHVALPDRHDASVGQAGQDVDVRPDALDGGRPDEHGVHRLVAQDGHHEVRLEAVQLAAEGVALDGHVEQAAGPAHRHR